MAVLGSTPCRRNWCWMKSSTARRSTWCLRSRMLSLVWAWPGDISRKIPWSELQDLRASELHPLASSIWRVCGAPKCLIHARSRAEMKSSVCSLFSTRAAISFVEASMMVNTGTGLGWLEESWIHMVSARTRLLNSECFLRLLLGGCGGGLCL